MRHRSTGPLARVFLVLGVLALAPRPAVAQCVGVPDHAALSAALAGAVGGNGGLNNEMWATVVDRDGIVCVVTFSGADRDDQWPGSRIISAQKANTANAFSLTGFPLSTANIYSAVQPGGSLFGLQESNPVNPVVAYAGAPAAYGAVGDPMVNGKIGGVNVFGGGLALYNAAGRTRRRGRRQRRHVMHRSHCRVEGPSRLESGQCSGGRRARRKRQHHLRYQGEQRQLREQERIRTP